MITNEKRFESDIEASLIFPAGGDIKGLKVQYYKYSLKKAAD